MEIESNSTAVTIVGLVCVTLVVLALIGCCFYGLFVYHG